MDKVERWLEEEKELLEKELFNGSFFLRRLSTKERKWLILKKNVIYWCRKCAGKIDKIEGRFVAIRKGDERKN